MCVQSELTQRAHLDLLGGEREGVAISVQQLHPRQSQRVGVSPPSSEHQLHHCRDSQTVSPHRGLPHCCSMWDL